MRSHLKPIAYSTPCLSAHSASSMSVHYDSELQKGDGFQMTPGSEFCFFVEMFLAWPSTLLQSGKNTH